MTKLKTKIKEKNVNEKILQATARRRDSEGIGYHHASKKI